jgi:plastocyanin
MNKNRIVVAALVTLAFALTIFVGSQAPTNAQSCRIIRLYGETEPTAPEVRIEPSTLLVTKGACVIWSNWIKAQEIKIIFEDGKTCEDVTDAATGFKLDAETCYVASFVSQGGTSSLRFTEEGTFKYKVTADAKVTAEGQIVVKE